MTGPTRATARGQAESIGVVLLLGVVVVSVSAFGLFYLTDGFDAAADGAGGDAANVVGDLTRERLVLSHRGGRSLPTASLRVVVRDASGSTEYDFDPALTTGGDGDDTFEAGESWRLDWDPDVGEELRVTVVDADRNRVLFDEARTVRATPTPEPDNPARGETPTATPEDGGESPSALARGGSVEGRSGETLTLDGSGSSDPEGDDLSYEWEVVDGDGLPPDAARIVEDSTATPNATFEMRENATDRDREVRVRLTVSDGHGAARDGATVRVEKHNRPPEADAGGDAEMSPGGGRAAVSPGAAATRPDELGFGPAGHAGTPGTGSAVAVRRFGGASEGPVGSVTLDGSGSSDPDGDDLSYEWEIVDDGGLGDRLELSDPEAVRPVLSLTDPVTDRDRTVTVRLTVTDDDGATDADAADVAVPTVDRDGVSSWLEWLFRLLFG